MKETTMKPLITVLFIALIIGAIYTTINVPIKEAIEDVTDTITNIPVTDEYTNKTITFNGSQSPTITNNTNLPWYSEESDIKIPISNYTIIFAIGVMIQRL